MLKSLCIVIPNYEYLNQAGARIRYLRLKNFLEERGYILVFDVVDNCIRDKCKSYDIYLISKCYSSTAVLLAQMAKISDKFIGVDLFDDYFSQKNDVRFVRLRNWLRNLSIFCDYCLCSTERISQVANEYFKNKRVHVLNDPIDSEDMRQCFSLFAAKKEVLQETQTLEICWFGIGDNPDFQVGLSDLFGFRDSIYSLIDSGFKVNFTVLTNKRALGVDNLVNLNKLGIKINLDIWSEEKEKFYLRNAFLCFIPVNYQSFSVVKSLNRCLTAFTHGCQVISPGYNLYSKFEDFIYTDSKDFLFDLERFSFKLSDHSYNKFMSVIDANGDPNIETDNLTYMLSELFDNVNQNETRYLDYGFIIGHTVPLAQISAINNFSDWCVSTPFSISKIKPHCRFLYDKSTGFIQLFVRADSLEKFKEACQFDIEILSRIEHSKAIYYNICLEAFFSNYDGRFTSYGKIQASNVDWTSPDFIFNTLDGVVALCRDIFIYFTGVKLLLLEESKGPWRIPECQVLEVNS